jgi:hypothetical protein
VIGHLRRRPPAIKIPGALRAASPKHRPNDDHSLGCGIGSGALPQTPISDFDRLICTTEWERSKAAFRRPFLCGESLCVALSQANIWSSVVAIATWIRLTLRPARVVDVGCGPGHLIEALHRDGIDVLGLDYSAAAMEHVSRKGLPFLTFDLMMLGVLPGSHGICCVLRSRGASR